jgi:hypothetical protein
VGKATVATVAVKGLLESAGGALVAGQEGATASEDLRNLRRKAAARLHLSFIR